MRKQGRSTSELAFTAAAGVIGSWIGFILNVLVLCFQFWVALYPIDGEPSPSTFFQAYLSAPVVLFMYICAKIWLRSSFIFPSTMDITTGTRNIDKEVLEQEAREEMERIRSKGVLYRVYKFWC
jgi:amino acid transporter